MGAMKQMHDKPGASEKHRCWSRAAVRGGMLVIALVASQAFAALTAEEIIAKVREVHKTAAYEGVRVVELWGPRGKITIKQKAIFGGDGKQRFEVISPAAQAGEVVVCDGRQQWRYVPREKTVYVLPPIPPPYGVGPKHDVYRGRRHHGSQGRGHWGPTWRLIGRERVAGRECYVLGLVTHRGRQIAKLWVDVQKFVILGGELATPDHARGKRWKFERVSFSPKIGPETFKFRPPPGTRVVKRAPAAKRMPLPQAEAAAGMKALIPTRLPEGFFLLRDKVGVITRDGRKALWLVFTNGAETFSIFQSRRLPRRLPLPRGAVARWDVGPYTLIVVGRVSQNDLELMRKSLPAPSRPGGRRRGWWGR